MLDLKNNHLVNKVLFTDNIKNLSASISPETQNQFFVGE
jgi:hypothetical protein